LSSLIAWECFAFYRIDPARIRAAMLDVNMWKQRLKRHRTASTAVAVYSDRPASLFVCAATRAPSRIYASRLHDSDVSSQRRSCSEDVKQLSAWRRQRACTRYEMGGRSVCLQRPEGKGGCGPLCDCRATCRMWKVHSDRTSGSSGSLATPLPVCPRGDVLRSVSSVLAVRACSLEISRQITCPRRRAGI
jgi:hypothetical protein